jgi:hypothetical protein
MESWARATTIEYVSGRDNVKRVLLTALLAAISLVLLPAASSFAAKTHKYIETIGHPAGGEGTHWGGSMWDVSVEESTGNIFVGHTPGSGPNVQTYTTAVLGPNGELPSGVTDPYRIIIAATTGKTIEYLGIDVDNSPTSPSQGDLYVADVYHEAVEKFALNPASEEYELEQSLSAVEPVAVAVDDEGNVFVADRQSQVIDKYDSDGQADGQIPIGFFPRDVAVDSEGSLYVQEAGSNPGNRASVVKFTANASGEIEPGTQPVEIVSGDGRKPSSNPTAIEVDRSTDELYVGFRDYVQQFDTDGDLAGEFGLGDLRNSSGIVINGQTGRVYVVDHDDNTVLIFGPTVIAPDVTTGTATDVLPTSVTLSGTVSAAGGLDASCEFQYVDDASFQENGFQGAPTAPCDPAGPFTGTDTETVGAEVSGLVSQTLYHYRLIGTSDNGITRDKAQTFFTPGPPRIDDQAISAVGATTAAFTASINPSAEPTSYVFEYVSQADFEVGGYANALEVPVGGEDIGSGFEGVAVSQAVGGLLSATNYLFRVMATNPLGSTPGPDQFFTTTSTQGFVLPDGRAFEQVTPTDKNGTAPSGSAGLVQAALDGSGVTFASGGGIPGSEGAQQYPTYLAYRGADWTTRGLLPPAIDGSAGAVLGWSEDLSQSYALLSPIPAAPTAFLQSDTETNTPRTIIPEGASQSESEFYYIGSSTDSTSVFFESTSQLLPGAVKGSNLYVWDRASGELTLAGALNSGTAPNKGVFVVAPSAAAGRYTQPLHAVSSDGTRVFFADTASSQLYVRENPKQFQSALGGGGECVEPEMACTVQLTASQRTTPDPKGKKPATFWGATPSGSIAFFTSSGKLTDDATTGPNDEGNDLYAYELGSGELTDLTPDPVDVNGAEVQGVLGYSDDGDYVYFAANGVFDSAPGKGTCSGGLSSGTGKCSLYLWHAGEITFISQLQLGSGETSDGANWQTGRNASREGKSSRVSAGGEALLFRSQLRLTSYDNEGVSEFYRYSAVDQDLHCVSCDPSGHSPLGGANLQSSETTRTIPNPSSILTRNLSADGNRVFFESPDRLVAADINGIGSCPWVFENHTAHGATRFCQDVYEWEAKGTGSCHSDFQNGGCLYLISTGTSAEPSYFGDASPSGDDVFIFTEQSLVGQDDDQIVDIYDARVGGGIPSQFPSPPPPPCEGEACKGAVPPSPASQSPGSATFSGPGNQKSAAKKKRKHHQKKAKKKKKKAHHKRHATSRKHG